MKRPQVSIVVPIYNGQAFLPHCLDSISSQTLDDLEVILVNDGSTDLSEEICQSYLRRDKRFKLVTQKNKGLAAARNEGLLRSNGDYIGFVDSDDWIDPAMYKTMYEIAAKERCQIVCTNVKKNGTIKNPAQLRDGVFTREQIRQEIFPRLLAPEDETCPNRGVLRWSNCCRLFDRSHLTKNKISFGQDFRRCQDLPFTFSATIYADRYCYLSDSFFYNNRQSPNSLSRSYTKGFWQLLVPLLSHLEVLVNRFTDYDFRPAFHLRVLLTAIDALENEVKYDNPNGFWSRTNTIKMVINDTLVRSSLHKLPQVRLKKATSAYLSLIRLRLAFPAYYLAALRTRKRLLRDKSNSTA